VLVEQATPRVLVIEHHVWMRSEVVAQLMAAGCQVQQASNGFSGFRLAHYAIPDMIVLGAELPDLASAELLEELERDPRTRAIAVIPLMSQAGEAYGSLVPAIKYALARQAARW
jgi:CheY-like chemotaxis protein